MTVKMSDVRSVRYFWREKDSPARWVGWKEFAAEQPAFAAEWEAYLKAVDTARLLFENSLDRLEIGAVEDEYNTETS